METDAGLCETEGHFKQKRETFHANASRKRSLSCMACKGTHLYTIVGEKVSEKKTKIIKRKVMTKEKQIRERKNENIKWFIGTLRGGIGGGADRNKQNILHLLVFRLSIRIRSLIFTK
eukprot:1068792_1